MAWFTLTSKLSNLNEEGIKAPAW